MLNYSAVVLSAGGIYNLLFGFFHIFFWRAKFLNWQEELPLMSPINRAVIQMMNIGIITFLLFTAYISFAYTQELLQPGLGKALLVGIATFWAARLVGEFTLKKGTPVKPVLVAVLVVGVLLYLLPAVFS